MATAKLGGGAPVSYHHHIFTFIIFLSSGLLVISRFSRIKFCYDLAFSSSFGSLFVIESGSYIIKIIFELRALLSCYDLEKKKRREKKEIKRLYNDLMGSDDFTYKKYDEYILLGVDKHSFGHCCN